MTEKSRRRNHGVEITAEKSRRRNHGGDRVSNKRQRGDLLRDGTLAVGIVKNGLQTFG